MVPLTLCMSMMSLCIVLLLYMFLKPTSCQFNLWVATVDNSVSLATEVWWQQLLNCCTNSESYRSLPTPDKNTANSHRWEHFSLAHPFMIKMCEVILYRDSNFPLYSDGSWTAEDKKNALAYMIMI